LLMDASQDLMAGTFDECLMRVMGRTGSHRVFPEGDCRRGAEDGEQTTSLPGGRRVFRVTLSQGSSLHLLQVPDQT